MVFRSAFDPPASSPSLRSLIGIFAAVVLGIGVTVYGYVRSTEHALATEQALGADGEAREAEPPQATTTRAESEPRPAARPAVTTARTSRPTAPAPVLEPASPAAGAVGEVPASSPPPTVYPADS